MKRIIMSLVLVVSFSCADSTVCDDQGNCFTIINGGLKVPVGK